MDNSEADAIAARRSELIRAAEARQASAPVVRAGSIDSNESKAEAARVRTIELERLVERGLIGKNDYLDVCPLCLLIIVQID